MIRPFRVLELYCGIGGCAAALGDRADVVAAIDIDRDALAVHRANFAHPVVPRTIESIPAADFQEWSANLWWLSPPCQPYTLRGRQRDLDDPRAESFKVLLKRILERQPRYLALENVSGFATSRAHAALREVLHRCDYQVAERLICPTELGIPNRRRRFYLVASQDRLLPWPALPKQTRILAAYLDPCANGQTFVPLALIEKYRDAIDLVYRDDPDAVTSCFTSGYGRSVVRSGSYLSEPGGFRRFTPREVLRLLGFPADFHLPPNLSLRRGWSLAGNSLSVDVVRWLLSAIPELRTQED